MLLDLIKIKLQRKEAGVLLAEQEKI